MKPLAPNTLLQNRYLIVHLIGKGGMGEVYLAVDQRLGSAVALKRTFFSDDEMLGSAFEREARTLARLRHPVLPKVSDHFTENDLQYLVMEHITGDDLSKRLEITSQPFPLNWVLFWADQLLDALAYLHGHEPPIIHRDIKPQNLKLTDENHIVLLDFGLAKDTVGNTKVSSTTGGSIIGYTPHYASMEQIRGTGTNARSDLYSMSATFYQLLTNVIPPDALSRADTVLSGMPDPAKPLYEINPEIPKKISDVIMKGMALSMEHRYTSAREMQKVLREAYAEMQSIMAAQTMAFNSPNQSVPQSQQPTEQFSTNVAGQPPAQNTPSTAPAAFDLSPEAESKGNQPQAQNFDPAGNGAVDQMGMKTEVIPFEKMPRPEDYASSNHPAAPSENFAAEELSSAPPEDFNPDATIPPMIHFGNQEAQPSAAASNFDSSPKNERDDEPEDDNFQPPQPIHQAEPAFSPVQTQAEPNKKSGGKGLAVAAGVGGLVLMLISAAAIGWYALKPAEATGSQIPTPTPQVEATVAPTAEPTVEPTVEAILNTTGTPLETVSSTPDEVKVSDTENTETRAQKSPTPTGAQPTPAKSAPTPRVVTAKTPPPVKTPAPAKTPVKTDRTGILQ